MPENLQDKFIYRMIHYENVEYILRNGICSRTHKDADPDYINIGDTNLIQQRNEYAVGVDPPGGNLGDYVPFYFGGHSPMLLNIKTGHRGITQRPQQDIVFICCKISKVVEVCEEWCFTDGHAKNNLTDFYNDLEYLSEVDWNAVAAKQWTSTEDDMDRFRKKQAEFLVKDCVPVEAIHCLVVRNEARKREVENIVGRLGLTIPVYMDTENKLYYP